MTKITYRDYYDKILIIAEGHSGYATCGEDIVCAGVSTLIYTLINALLDEEAWEHIKFLRNIQRDGYIYLEIEYFDFSKERVHGITDTFLTGVLMLQENYPKYITME